MHGPKILIVLETEMHQQAREYWWNFSFLFVPARMKDTCASVSLLSWGVVPTVSVRVCICPNEGSATQVHLILDSRNVRCCHCM